MSGCFESTPSRCTDCALRGYPCLFDSCHPVLCFEETHRLGDGRTHGPCPGGDFPAVDAPNLNSGEKRTECSIDYLSHSSSPSYCMYISHRKLSYSMYYTHRHRTCLVACVHQLSSFACISSTVFVVLTSSRSTTRMYLAGPQIRKKNLHVKSHERTLKHSLDHKTIILHFHSITFSQNMCYVRVMPEALRHATLVTCELSLLDTLI